MADENTEAKQATAEEPEPDPNLITTLPDGAKVKRRKLRQRACNEPAKKAICAGHLKRWFFAGDDVKRQFGDEIYRCEKCQTLYLPNPEEEPRSGTLVW